MKKLGEDRFEQRKPLRKPLRWEDLERDAIEEVLRDRGYTHREIEELRDRSRGFLTEYED